MDLWEPEERSPKFKWSQGEGKYIDTATLLD